MAFRLITVSSKSTEGVQRKRCSRMTRSPGRCKTVHLRIVDSFTDDTALEAPGPKSSATAYIHSRHAHELDVRCVSLHYRFPPPPRLPAVALAPPL